MVTATAGNAQATVSFMAPASDGGSSITGYTVTSNPAGGVDSSAGTTSTSHVITTLVNGTPYTFTVIATNVAGPGMASSASNSVTPSVPPISLVSVNSRKMHNGMGPFDILVDHTIPISGLVSVEPRFIGTSHTLVFQFSGAVSNPGTLTTTAGSATHIASGNNVIVTLTGVSDPQRVTILLTNVNGSVNASASVGFFVGDVNFTRAVNAADIVGVKSRIGQAVSSTTANFDVNTSGTIDAADVSAVKARSGAVLP